MRYFVVFLFALAANLGWAQKDTLVNIKGTVVNNETKLPISNVNVINATRVTGTATSGSGTFEIATKLNDTLLFSYVGFETNVYSFSHTQLPLLLKIEFYGVFTV